MRSAARSRASAASLLLLLGACSSERPVDLSPARWPADTLGSYLAMTAQLGMPKALAEGDTAMVTGTTGAVAERAGLEALRQGGTAADAAITTALTQITLAAGSWVSFAGFMNLIYFDAASREVHTLHAGFGTVRGETDPTSIPACTESSGRTALVPGFFAGVQALHDRYGRLPFDRLFAPAIYFAEHGVPVTPMLQGMFAYRKDLLLKRADTRAIFGKSDTTLYVAGDTLRQPALAETLRHVATEGADYIYRGAWARQLVDAVQAEGGKLALEDLAAYQAIWGDPVRGTYRGYELLGTPWPNFGATKTIEAMQVLEHADLASSPRYWEAAEPLYWLVEASHLNFLLGPPGGGVGVPDGWASRRFPDRDLSQAGRLSKPTAQFWWDQIRGPGWRILEADAAGAQREAAAELARAAGGGGHSDAVVVVDPMGNVAALTHTINTAVFGGTGINVGGISIPDAACFQQDLIRRVGPGARLPEPTNPLLVMKDGEWVLAGSSIGAGLHENTLAVLVNVLDYGRDPHQGLHAPQFSGTGLLGPQILPDGDFSPELVAALNARGGHAELAPKATIQGGFGSWISIQRDPKTGRLRGATREMYNGLALGY